MFRDTIIQNLIKQALAEDIGIGDHTSLAIFPPDHRCKMQLIAKSAGIIAGVEVARTIFHIHDPDISINIRKHDGDTIHEGDLVFIVEGRTVSILSIERVVLNFMQRMSGIATYTRSLVNLIQDLPTKILDTRKTTPNFRVFEKMAVRIGGGYNHRFGLYDMILIKDNHIDAAGSVTTALLNVYDYLAEHQLSIPVEIEVRNFNELYQVLEFGKVQRILFDNFEPATLREAVSIVQKRHETEASGQINHTNIRQYAETGVDFISIGALTHQIKSLDLSLKIL